MNYQTYRYHSKKKFKNRVGLHGLALRFGFVSLITCFLKSHSPQAHNTRRTTNTGWSDNLWFWKFPCSSLNSASQALLARPKSGVQQTILCGERVFHSTNRLSCFFWKSLGAQKEGELGQRRKERSPFEKITLLDYRSWKLVCNFAPGDQTANQECCQEQNGIPNKLAMSKKPIQHRIKADKENKFIQPTLSEFLITCTSFSHRRLSSSTGTVERRKNESHFINLLLVQTPKNVI